MNLDCYLTFSMKRMSIVAHWARVAVPSAPQCVTVKPNHVYRNRQTKPSPSQYSAFTLSLRRPQNRNSVLVNGSSSTFCCTSVAIPSIPLRRSVYPTARNTLSDLSN